MAINPPNNGKEFKKKKKFKRREFKGLEFLRRIEGEERRKGVK